MHNLVELIFFESMTNMQIDLKAIMVMEMLWVVV